MIAGALISVFAATTLLAMAIISIDARGLRNYFDSLFQRLKWSASVKLTLQRADLNLTYSEYALLYLALAATAGVIGYFVGGSFLTAMGGAIIGAMIPRIYVHKRKARKLKLFIRHFPDTVRLIAQVVSKGISLLEAFKLISENKPYPISAEFGKLSTALEHSGGLPECLDDLHKRVPLEEVYMFATTIKLTYDSGGDLSGCLFELADNVDARIHTEGEIKTKTAQGKLQGMVLMPLPIILCLALLSIQPELIIPLFTEPLGLKILAIAFTLQIIGALLMYKVVNIRI